MRCVSVTAQGTSREITQFGRERGDPLTLDSRKLDMGLGALWAHLRVLDSSVPVSYIQSGLVEDALYVGIAKYNFRPLESVLESVFV